MKQRNRRQAIITALLTLSATLWAQGPHQTGDYYQPADGRSGAELKTALGLVVLPHVTRSYRDLWEDFRSTDLRADGKIWDMYSAITNYTPGVDQNTGSARKEGDNYNREHSMPSSWFNRDYPMFTDLHHVCPTDSWLNSKRGSEPFGETYAPTFTSAEGFSKMGPARDGLGYDGIVFEPADEYKGDFARAYFYMVTCYENYVDAQGNRKSVSSWNSTMLARNVYPALSPWAVEMLMRWSADDPVSEKELNRNEAVWAIQKNRNPYIDYPGLEQYVWGSKTDVAFSYNHYGQETDGIRLAESEESPKASEWGARATVYTLSGQRVDARPLPKGVYVRDGRKFVVR